MMIPPVLEPVQSFDYSGTTKECLIENARAAVAAGFDFNRVGYKSIGAYIQMVNEIDPILYQEWISLKPGDMIKCRPCDTFGCRSDIVRVDKAMDGPRGGFMFDGDGSSVSVWSGGYPQTVFITGFEGIVK